jgi:stalled ribosome rescue protein Dom34
MDSLNHAIVWIDHSEAKVCRFGGTEDSEVDVHSHTSLQRLHHRQGGWEAGGNPPDDAEFFRRTLATLDHVAGIVVTGPGNARTAFRTYIDAHRPEIASQVFSVETDDRSDQALLALGRVYFHSNGSTPPRVVTP